MTNRSTFNQTLPIFFKSKEYKFLIIGSDKISLQLVTELVDNYADCKLKVVALNFDEEWKKLEQSNQQLELKHTHFNDYFLNEIDFVITSTINEELFQEIRQSTLAKNTPLYAMNFLNQSDFLLGSSVVKGNIKIAVSSFSSNDALEKRLVEVIDDSLPNAFSDSAENLVELESKLKGDFHKRVNKLNRITELLIQKHDRKWHEFDYKKIIFNTLGILGIMIAGYVLFSLIPPVKMWETTTEIVASLDSSFLYFMLGGFIAQMIDGALGMAYGVSATTFLLSFGISPAVASMSVHASEIFTSGVSGLMHLKFGNVHHKLFKAIVIPGVIGAILGAYLLTSFEHYSIYIKPIVGVYTLFLGSLIIYKVLRKNQKRKRVKHAGYLATLGGFLDSIGGGGWGPVVSSTLIASGKNPRLVVGSVNLAEFFVSLASSFTFFTILGASHWQTIVGLILGGVCAAPIAANLSRRLNIKAMMLLVGIVVIIVSLRIIIISIIG